MMQERRSGVLLHITSLPSSYGIGNLGPAAYKFADFMNKAGLTYWQILPLNPVEDGSGFSPYSGLSAFAGNPMLISPELLVKDSYLKKEELSTRVKFPAGPGRFRPGHPVFGATVGSSVCSLFKRKKANGSKKLTRNFVKPTRPGSTTTPTT